MKTQYVLLILLALCIASCRSKEEKKQRAEEKSRYLVEKKSRIAKGIGEALKGEGKEAATSVSEGVGEVVKGVNTGFDESLTKVTVTVGGSLTDKLELGRTGKYTNDSLDRDVVTAYLIFKQGFQGTLQLKAFDKEKKEIGRSTVKADGKTDDTKYVDFIFDERTPLSLAESYTMELKK